ncbi:cytochrome C oxidase subunit II [Radiobacillus deserti]|uniref:Cytochrome C oxidase subunit II n=1 Tax=Radiobacillus deserti TaxID=2594883 RepID=A0A516KE13_9BACI|nr:cytochrome C oxidase subunit II [Radiobacillus deserti]QDP39607.1 cytochrome C oxidase subunit II [Radiobacillus deserti]
MGKQKNNSHDYNLKGTLISVFVIGFVIIAMWSSAYAIYISR